MQNGLLFEKGIINKMELKNRAIMLALHTGFAEGSFVSERDMEFYRTRAAGGAGAIVVVGFVNRRGGMVGMHSLETDECIPGNRALSDMLHEHGCKLIFQLFHCGRNGNEGTLEGKKPLAPSVVPSPIYRADPEEMTVLQIKDTISDFAAAALRCKKSGVDAVEISCTAGYLLTEFLSPTTNLRTDEYGGCEENRMRMPFEVMRAVRNAVGKDYPVILRVSASQMIPGGYDIALTQRLCKKAEEEKLVDAINVTGGWHECAVPQITYHVPKGSFAFMSAAIKAVVDIPVVCANRINDYETAEKVLEKGLADFIGFGRAFVSDPEFINKIKEGKPINICQGCNKCLDRVLKNKDMECAFNPLAGREYLEKKLPEINKKILIIGAGPGGLMSAYLAARRGADVTVITKDEVLGGALNLAAIPPNKQDISLYMKNKEAELKALGVNIIYNKKADEKFIKDLSPDLVLVATGGEPIVPNWEGKDSKNVYMGEAVLLNRKLNETLRKGKTLIIGGGVMGIEVALDIADNIFLNQEAIDFMNINMKNGIPEVYAPSDITIIEMTKRIGAELGGVKWIVLKELKDFGVKTMTETKVIAIKEGYILAETPKGEVKIPADNIVLALGYKPKKQEIIDYLEKSNIPYKVIGDAKEVRDAMGAHVDAFTAIASIN